MSQIARGMSVILKNELMLVFTKRKCWYPDLSRTKFLELGVLHFLFPQKGNLPEQNSVFCVRNRLLLSEQTASNIKMAKYDSKGVPVLSFHNPAGMILYPAGLYTYAMGNTRARDLTEFLGTSNEQHLDLLLLACGDVRNILYTVSELSMRKSHERPTSLNFHLNDYDPTVIARNAVLLEAAGVINPDIPADIDFLWNIWYNLALSKSHFDRLQEILSELLERDFDSHESVLKFQNNAILQECRDIWKDWLGLDLEVNSVKEDRNRSLEEKRQQYNFSLDKQCLLVLTQMTMAFNDYKEAALMLPTATNPFYTEIKHWFCEGSTSDESEKTNPTLIRPFIHKWKLHYSSCAFESYLPFER